MSPTAGMMLVVDILPLIQAAITKGAVKPTGCEDAEELQAEAVAMAAQGLESIERRGKQVSASSVAYYAIERLKHGRRSGYAGYADALSPAASLRGLASVRSLEAPIGTNPDDPQEEFCLHDVLAGTSEDADVVAARELDWENVLAGLDERRKKVLIGTADGTGTTALAQGCGVSAPRVCQIRESIGQYIVGAWGGNGLADVTTVPKYRARMRAGTERRAGRHERAWNP